MPAYHPSARPRRSSNRIRERRAVPWYAWLVGGVIALLLVSIVGCCALSGLMAGLVGRLRNAPEVTTALTRTFAVSGTPDLVVTNQAGAVRVMAGNNGQVTVEATKRVRDRTDQAAHQALDAIRVDLTQQGNTVTVSVRYPFDRSSFFTDERAVDIDITAPPSANVTTTLAAGNLTMQGITGRVGATVNAGRLDLEGVTLAGTSRLLANAGDVTLVGALAGGTLLDIQVNSGNATVRLPAATSAHLDARASVGNVSISGWPIAVNRSNVAGAHAAGDLSPNPTSTITIRVDSGNATIQAQ